MKSTTRAGAGALREGATRVLLGGVHCYRRYISFLKPPCCRYTPTCSQYALDSIRKHGPLLGTWKAICRVARCHPFHPGGYDPA